MPSWQHGNHIFPNIRVTSLNVSICEQWGFTTWTIIKITKEVKYCDSRSSCKLNKYLFLSPPEGGLDLVTNRKGAI